MDPVASMGHHLPGKEDLHLPGSCVFLPAPKAVLPKEASRGGHFPDNPILGLKVLTFGYRVLCAETSDACQL